MLFWLLLATAQQTCSACTVDLDCSLNGVCVAGTCQCDAAWEGEECERFATLPASPTADVKEAATSTWGTGTLAGQLEGEYHLYASEFVGSCGVTAWQTNSQIVRFASTSPTGPWQRKELSLPVWAHCGSAAASPNGTPSFFNL